MTDLVQCIDNNYPGTVYRGTVAQMSGMDADGSCTQQVHVDLARPAGAAEREAKILASGGIPEMVMPVNDWERRDAR
jgi:hypothetical protein